MRKNVKWKKLKGWWHPNGDHCPSVTLCDGIGTWTSSFGLLLKDYTARNKRHERKYTQGMALIKNGRFFTVAIGGDFFFPLSYFQLSHFSIFSLRKREKTVNHTIWAASVKIITADSKHPWAMGVSFCPSALSSHWFTSGELWPVWRNIFSGS